MNTEKPVTNTVSVKIELSKKQKTLAKQYAKKQGYSFQWWLGSLVKEELKKSDLIKSEKEFM